MLIRIELSTAGLSRLEAFCADRLRDGLDPRETAFALMQNGGFRRRRSGPDHGPRVLNKRVCYNARLKYETPLRVTRNAQPQKGVDGLAALNSSRDALCIEYDSFSRLFKAEMILMTGLPR